MNRKSFVTFQERGRSPSGKTARYVVQPNDSEASIGDVQWYAPWRCYAFYPRANTVFERWCLRDIADFCEAKTVEHWIMKVPA